ncbi:MAG: transaldolase [Chloroflexia bacterium]|nr:transaldolase [Chloroflexia bacterium]
MRLYIDSAVMPDIEEALASGYVYGVTSNPTLLRRADVRAAAVPDLVRHVFALGAKEMHVQTYADDAESIVREGQELAALDSRIVVKIPATAAGFKAASQLSGMGLRVTLTAVYTVQQAILANAVGAHYIAVYLGRMRDAGLDALDVVGRMQRTLDTCATNAPASGHPVEILAASVRTPEEVEALADIRVATATMPLNILRMLPESPATGVAAATFSEDAKALR